MSDLFVPPVEVIAFLERHHTFLLFGHLEPDADSIASQLVLSSFLRRRGKQASVYSEGPFDRPEIHSFQDRFHTKIESSQLQGNPAAVVLDCSTPDRVGSMSRQLQELPLLVIDHHASGEPFGDVRWVEPRAPSVSYMIQRLIEEYPDAPTREEAVLLLFGLARDTGFFRHLVEGSGFVFQAAARLADRGASPREVYHMIHSGWELAKARLLALCLERAASELEGRALLTYQTLEDLRAAGWPAARGSDEVYRVLQAVKGVEVVAFIQEERSNRCSVGLRSNGGYDVGTLAGSMGGGGHPLAAGYTVAGSVSEVRARLLQALRRLLDA